MRLMVALGVCFVGMSACVTRATVRENFVEHGLDRAAFELQCDKAKLELVPLNPPLEAQFGLGSQVGVVGCGKRAVYVRGNGGWLANTAGAEPAQPK